MTDKIPEEMLFTKWRAMNAINLALDRQDRILKRIHMTAGVRLKIKQLLKKKIKARDAIKTLF